MDLIEEYLKGKNYDEYMNNRMLQDAIIREIEIIGVATKNISKTLKNKYPDIPWKKNSGMRDKLIHSYFGVDLNAVWNTAVEDITQLKSKIIKVINEK